MYIEVYVIYFSAIYVLDGDFSEEEKYVIIVFQRTHEIRVCKKVLKILFSLLFGIYSTVSRLCAYRSVV